MMMDFRDNVQKCQEYIQALQDERRKIQVFQRELPLCLELVTQAIETCKQQLSGSGMDTGTTNTAECLNGHSECSEQTTTSDGPVLEEFIPIKRCNSTDDDGDEHEQESNKTHLDKPGKKSDWLRSVQLWNSNPDPFFTPEVHEHQPKRVSVVEVQKNGGAFHPFHKEKGSCSSENNKNNNNKPTSSLSACSSAEAAGKKEEKDGSQSQLLRKARRCWSPELHRRFLHALQQLGGSHVATPKQIRELMKVDGLTNDEVKSHLQKYRLHTRRPSNTTVHHSNPNPQTAQFVVVGGIWVPPSEQYQAGVGAPMVVAGVHSSSPQKKQSSPSEERGSLNITATPSDGGVHSHSPATSTGSHHAY